ncbi:MAG: hypothetical protein ACLGQH_09555 [Acidobacteriota bacterium]
MRFEVPYVPDAAYAALLTERAEALEGVYFRLGPDSPDARLPGLADPSPMELAAGLAALPDMPRLGLLNAAFHAPGMLAGDQLRELILVLEGYVAAGAVNGIVYADQYLLRAVSDEAPELAATLSAVPSINFRLATFERAAAVIDAACDTRFRPPSSVLLDRDCNRDPDALAALAEGLRREWPELRIGVMANEGCLYACPYKTAHDAHIALSRLTACRVGAELNRDLGCLRDFVAQPERLLASPFLRPEDVGQLEGLVDFVKVCGRSRLAADLRGIVTAYLDGQFAGNLLWLLDTPEILSDRYALDNAALPEDFYARTAGCSRRCRTCGYCGELAARLLTQLEPRLAAYARG